MFPLQGVDAPMRISADESDPGYLRPADRRTIQVFLDGTRQARVITADDFKRLIIRCKEDCGHLVFENGEVLTETLSGDVEIKAGH
jgi:hypothetical protein